MCLDTFSSSFRYQTTTPWPSSQENNEEKKEEATESIKVEADKAWRKSPSDLQSTSNFLWFVFPIWVWDTNPLWQTPFFLVFSLVSIPFRQGHCCGSSPLSLWVTVSCSQITFLIPFKSDCNQTWRQGLINWRCILHGSNGHLSDSYKSPLRWLTLPHSREVLIVEW